MKKHHIGCACGHEEQIKKDDDAHYVEFADCYGEVCVSCFNRLFGKTMFSSCVIDSPNPLYNRDTNCVTDYYSIGSLVDFKVRQYEHETKTICTNIYGRAWEVECPTCNHGTYIDDENMFDETHECSKCGAEFTLAKDLPIY